MNDLIVKNVLFCGSELLAVKQKENGKVYVGINSILRELGFDERQIEYRRNKWNADKVLCKGVQKFSYPSMDGGMQETYCMEIKRLPLALAKIEVTPKMESEMPELSEKLEKYQTECADVLAEAFLQKEENKGKIEQGLVVVKFIADDLRVSESSRLFMYENYCKDVGIPTGFIPKYTNNGNKEQCSATELLQRNGCGIKASKFNQLMIAAGYMELRERKSSKGETKQYKALTDKGQKYGVNLISNQNQKECQPYYFADSFMELYHKVAG